MNGQTRTVRIPRKLTRDFAIEVGEREISTREDGTEEELYPVSLSSEFKVKRWSWDGAYYEVLSHDPDDVDLSRAEEGLPALKGHDVRAQIGSVKDVRIDTLARRLRGLLKFASIRLAKDQKTLVDEGHLRTTSIGYFVRGMRLLEEDEDGVPTYLVSWAPAELSLVPIPADPTVGLGREAELTQMAVRNVPEDQLVDFAIEVPAGEGRERSMDPKLVAGGEGVRTDPESPKPAAPEVTRDASKEAAEIFELCAEHGLTDRAAEFVREGLSPDKVRKIILDKIRTTGPAQPPAESLTAVPEKDRRAYSYARAMAMASGQIQRDGLELEVHQELIREGAKPTKGGLVVPWRLRGRDDFSSRALGTGEPAGGATLVNDQVMPEMIDLLRNKTRCLEFGARLYTGLRDVVHFNKKTGAPTVYWMQENPASGATASQTTYGYTTMSPKSLIGHVQIPRQLLTMASIDIEADIRNELAIGHATALDLAAIHGDGTANAPIGIYHTADVQSQAYTGVPDLPELTTAVGLVHDANASYGSLAWMTTALMGAVLSRTPLIGSTYPKFIWDGKINDGEMIGYRAGATNQCSKVLGAGSDEHALIFGNWNELAFGLWGNEMEIVLDETSKAEYGQVRLISFSMADVGILHPQGFVKGTGAKIA